MDGPHGWNEEMGYGAGLVATPPFFVVTHSPPAEVRLGLRFTFVPEGVAEAIAQARAAAGGKDVVVMGGGEVVALDQGLADELHLHIAPIVLGSGTPLFAACRRRPLVLRSVRTTPSAIHVVYRLEH